MFEFCRYPKKIENRHKEYYYTYLMDDHVDQERDDVGFDELQRNFCSRRHVAVIITISGALTILSFVIVFVTIPLIFMNSIFIQQSLIFTHFGLPHSEKYFQTYKFPAFRNEYVPMNWGEGTNKSLGVWHILPVELARKALHNRNFDYEASLSNSTYSVLIYFHGTGEARSYSTGKYQLLSYYFHIIAFDYRDYADSSPGSLSENAVVEDCVQLYHWVKNKTQSPIYVWGHSLGSALATSTVSSLEKSGIHTYGLVLESAFTNLRDELYVHPYGKVDNYMFFTSIEIVNQNSRNMVTRGDLAEVTVSVIGMFNITDERVLLGGTLNRISDSSAEELFAWLPWFKATILQPLHDNGFIFDTSSNIMEITCPIMILHAQDDSEVPCTFGRQLYEIASKRSPEASNLTVYHEFDADMHYDHVFIYQDPFLKYYIMDFMVMAANQSNLS